MVIRSVKQATYVEAPTNWSKPFHMKAPSIFLAGGITGCANWQSHMTSELATSRFRGTILNPRRENFPFPTQNSSAATEQITWEYHHLQKSDAILFWFDAATIQPIVLLEFGRWSALPGPTGKLKPLFVGVHPDYERKDDVRIQLNLVRPGHLVVDSLESLVEEVLEWSDPY